MSTDPSTTSGTISAKPAVPTKKRELIPVGDYLLKIDWVEKSMALNGKARLSFKFSVAAGPLEGKRCFQDCYITDAAVWKIQNLAALIGVPEDAQINPNDPKDLITKFQGKTFHGRVVADKYTNKEGAEVEARQVLWEAPKGKGPPETALDKEPARGADEETPF